MQVKKDAVHEVLAPGTHKCANSSHLRPLLHAFLKAKIFPFVCRFFSPINLQFPRMLVPCNSSEIVCDMRGEP